MKGIGTDIIEIKRISEVRQKERFIDKILSEEEVTLYSQFVSEKRKN